jgi:hypothetical protein
MTMILYELPASTRTGERAAQATTAPSSTSRRDEDAAATIEHPNELSGGLPDATPPRLTVPTSLDALSHEIRQPLMTLRMNLQVAVRLLRSPQPRVAAALDAVRDCLEAERDLAALLASTSRPLLQRSSRWGLVDLNKVASTVGDVLSHAWPARSGEFTVRLAERSPIIHGDAPCLHFALLSLARKALEWSGREANESGGVVIETRSAPAGAELDVLGIPLAMVQGPSLFTSIAVADSVVLRHGGMTIVEQGSSCAAIRMLMPTVVESPQRGVRDAE